MHRTKGICLLLLAFAVTTNLPSAGCQSRLEDSAEELEHHNHKPRRTLRTQHPKARSPSRNFTESEDFGLSTAFATDTAFNLLEDKPQQLQPPAALESYKVNSEHPEGVSIGKTARDHPETTTTGSSEQLRIPRILHQLYFVSDKRKEYETGSIEDKQFPKKWQASCKAAFPGWEYKFWTLDSAEAWMKKKFPGFMKIWHSYPRTVLKGDAFRAFVMKDMGGVYLDLDIECFQDRVHMIHGLDLVLQVAYPGAWDLDNGAFGSVAGHPFWDTYIHLLEERAHISPAEGPLRYDHVVQSTGPDVTYQAYLDWGKGVVRHGFVTDRIEKDGYTCMAYPLGEWYFPCLWDAVTCHADMNERKRNLDFPQHLAGHHYSVVSWFKELGEKI